MIKLKDLLIENDTKDRGGVLYCHNCEFLLCLGESSGKWHVPKGHIQKNETPLEGSVREFTEETQISLNGIPDLLHTWDSKGGTFHLILNALENVQEKHLTPNGKIPPLHFHSHNEK